MNRFFSLRRFALALSVLGVLAVAAPRAAAAEVPFTVDGTFTFTVLGRQGGALVVGVSGGGRASPGGPFTFEDIVLVRVVRGVQVVQGTLTFEFTSGSTVDIYYEAPIVNGVALGTFWIAGGTGLFDGVTGTGEICYPIGQNEIFMMEGVLSR